MSRSVWEQIAYSKPRLKAGIEVRQHSYGGEQWWLFREAATNRIFRMCSAAGDLIRLLDGRKTLEQVFFELNDRRGDKAIERQEAENFLLQLNSQELLDGLAEAPLAELSRKRKRERRLKLFSKYGNPLSIKIPLLDPIRFQDGLRKLAAVTMSRAGGWCWLVSVIVGAVLAMIHWQEIAANLGDQFFSLQNAVLGMVMYCLMKVLHELAHVLAMIRYGGRCREVGLLFIAFIPVPYVDASQATMLPRKWQRVQVSLAGIQSELLVASLATIVWVAAEPGILRAAMYNLMMIGWLNTLLFNGNPLQRFDGYFALQDAIEVPNLATRSARYYGYLCQRYLLAMDVAHDAVLKARDKRWFIVYWPASWVYRTAVLLMIALFVAESYPVIGSALALWAVMQMLAIPIVKFGLFVKTKHLTGDSRGGVLLLSTFWSGLVIVLLAVVPIPFATVVQGVVSLPEERQTRANANGFIRHQLVSSGEYVTAGTPLIQLENPLLIAQQQEKRAATSQLELQYQLDLVEDRVKAVISLERLKQSRQELAELDRRIENLQILARADGVFVMPEEAKSAGRFIRKGDSLGQIQPDQFSELKVVIPMDQVDPVRRTLQAVSVRPMHDLQQQYSASLHRLVPAATRQLPSGVLSLQGGGPFALEPGSRPQTHQPVYLAEVVLDQPQTMFSGSRVAVRFDHGYEPAAYQIWRKVRQTFLRRLDV